METPFLDLNALAEGCEGEGGSGGAGGGSPGDPPQAPRVSVLPWADGKLGVLIGVDDRNSASRKRRAFVVKYAVRYLQQYVETVTEAQAAQLKALGAMGDDRSTLFRGRSVRSLERVEYDLNLHLWQLLVPTGISPHIIEPFGYVSTSVPEKLLSKSLLNWRAPGAPELASTHALVMEKLTGVLGIGLDDGKPQITCFDFQKLFVAAVGKRIGVDPSQRTYVPDFKTKFWAVVFQVLYTLWTLHRGTLTHPFRHNDLHTQNVGLCTASGATKHAYAMKVFFKSQIAAPAAAAATAGANARKRPRGVDTSAYRKPSAPSVCSKVVHYVLPTNVQAKILDFGWAALTEGACKGNNCLMLQPDQRFVGSCYNGNSGMSHNHISRLYDMVLFLRQVGNVMYKVMMDEGTATKDIYNAVHAGHVTEEQAIATHGTYGEYVATYMEYEKWLCSLFGRHPVLRDKASYDHNMARLTFKAQVDLSQSGTRREPQELMPEYLLQHEAVFARFRVSEDEFLAAAEERGCLVYGDTPKAQRLPWHERQPNVVCAKGRVSSLLSNFPLVPGIYSFPAAHSYLPLELGAAVARIGSGRLLLSTDAAEDVSPATAAMAAVATSVSASASASASMAVVALSSAPPPPPLSDSAMKRLTAAWVMGSAASAGTAFPTVQVSVDVKEWRKHVDSSFTECRHVPGCRPITAAWAMGTLAPSSTSSVAVVAVAPLASVPPLLLCVDPCQWRVCADNVLQNVCLRAKE